jgi:hypothetical protein
MVDPTCLPAPAGGCLRGRVRDRAWPDHRDGDDRVAQRSREAHGEGVEPGLAATRKPS